MTTHSITQTASNQGINCRFEIDGTRITLWGSPFSGREIVYFGEEIVSDKRSFFFSGSHHFRRGENAYEVRFRPESILQGRYHCTLYRNGTLVDSTATTTGLSDEHTHPELREMDWRSQITGLFPPVLHSAVIGLATGLALTLAQALVA